MAIMMTVPRSIGLIEACCCRLRTDCGRMVGNPSVTRLNGQRRVRCGLPVIRPELGNSLRRKLLRFVLRGDDNPVSEVVRGNGFLGGLGECFGLA
jgi:hypothetical protein